jgi:hypothetical protein
LTKLSELQEREKFNKKGRKVTGFCEVAQKKFVWKSRKKILAGKNTCGKYANFFWRDFFLIKKSDKYRVIKND